MLRTSIACVLAAMLVTVGFTKLGSPSLLVVGSVTEDVIGEERFVGGAVSYAATVATAFGVRACVVYSAKAGSPPPPAFAGHQLVHVTAEESLTFEHTYTFWGNKRKLRVTAEPNVALSWSHVPSYCRSAKTILLGPLVKNDVDVASFTNKHSSIFHRWLGLDAKIVLMAQGLQRRLDTFNTGAVLSEAAPSNTLMKALAPNTLVFLSDVETDVWPPGEMEKVARKVDRVIITRGPDGADDVHAEDGGVRVQRHPAYQIKEVLDTNGAGDTFATAYAIALAKGTSHVEAAEIANFAGAIAVSQPQSCKPSCVADALRRELKAREELSLDVS